jgi:enterobactin synthetase component F
VLLPLRPTRPLGDRRPLFCIHPAGGISCCYAGLLRHLHPTRPVYGLQARGLARPEPLPDTIDAMARDYIRQLRRVQPEGPYHFLGWSVGGVVAHAVAVQLRDAGERVALLALLDAYPSDQWRGLAPPGEAEALVALLHMAGQDRRALGAGPLEREAVVAAQRRRGSALASLSPARLGALVEIVRNNSRLMREHVHRRFDGEVLFFTAAAPRSETWLDRDAWRAYAAGIENHDVACTHPELLRPGPLDRIGAVLAGHLGAPAAAPGAGTAPGRR